MAKYILAMDQGTTSSRAILFDHSGSIAYLSQKEYEQIYPKAGWVEHDPYAILKSQYDAVASVLAKSGVSAKDISAVAITNQRETTIVFDKNTGKPVYNAIVWQCRRTAQYCDALKAKGLSDYIKQKTGLIIDAYFSGTKVKWILDNVMGVRERAAAGELAFGTVDTWLLYNLSGGRVHATDYTNASRTMLFDIAKLEWDERILSELNIPNSMLPDVFPSSYEYGVVAEGIPGLELLAGVPICGVGGDQQCALFGQCCFSPGQTKNSYGTGCFMLMNTGSAKSVSKNNLITTIAWGLELGKVEYALEGSVFNAGSVIKWLIEDLQIIHSPQECDALAESVINTQGVIFVPAFTGLGAPYWDMYARGTMLGLTRGVTKAHIARATLESIAYQVKDLSDAMQHDSGIPLVELMADGGASRSDFMMQFQSDLIGVNVDRPKNVETTALGAAFLAGLKSGFWRNKDELRTIRESDRVFLPSMSESERERLQGEWSRAVLRAKNWATE